jgi:hypothetical protein
MADDAVTTTIVIIMIPSRLSPSRAFEFVVHVHTAGQKFIVGTPQGTQPSRRRRTTSPIVRCEGQHTTSNRSSTGCRPAPTATAQWRCFGRLKLLLLLLLLLLVLLLVLMMLVSTGGSGRMFPSFVGEEERGHDDLLACCFALCRKRSSRANVPLSV